MRLCLVAALLCSFLGSQTGVRAKGFVGKSEKSEAQVKANDGWLKQMAEEPQSPVESVLRTTSSSNRVISSRPSRLLPTHGGRIGHHGGRWASNGCSPLQTSLKRGFTQSTFTPGRGSSSPRLYYVIALRRLLC